MKKFRKYISYVLLAAVSFLITPQELVHAFTAHNDTTDYVCHDECAKHIENEHQHCDALQLTTPPLFLAVNNFSFSFDKVTCAASVERTSSYYFHSSPFLFFRGPPALTV